MIESTQPQNTNDETIENQQGNQNNLHIIKCEEKKTEFILESSQDIQQKLQTFVKISGVKSTFILAIIDIVFTILSLSTLIKNNKTYIKLKNDLNPNTDKTYTKIWMNIGKYELSILIPFLIFLVLVFLYILFLYLKDLNKIQLERKQGIFYYSILIFSFVSSIIIYIFLFFICYLNVYSIFVLAKVPNDFNSINAYLDYKKELQKHIVVPIIHIVFNFIVVWLSSFIIWFLINNIKSYLDIKFEENQIIKTGILSINDINFSINMKPDYLYLLQSEENREDFYKIANLKKEYPSNRSEVTALNKTIKCLTFIKILLNDFINEYIYMILENQSIIDQLPLTSQGYNNLSILIFFSLANLLFISVPSSKIHIKNEKEYNEKLDYYNVNAKKPKFFGIFKIYGKFEQTVTTIRIIYLTIEVCSLFFLIIRKLIVGGFKKIIQIKSLIICYIALLLINFMDIIFSLLIILFSILCNISKNVDITIEEYSDDTYYEKKELEETSILSIKLVFQIIVNFLALCITNIVLIIFTIKSLLYQFDIIKSRKRLEEQIVYKDLKKEIVFEFRNKNNNRKRLVELRYSGLPKFLFFKHENITQSNNNNQVLKNDNNKLNK